MNTHSYLRAYMAGVLMPTWVLLIVLAIFATGLMPVPFERLMVFPMAVVPNSWGIWNVLYHAIARKRRFALGAWGALLPVILIPAGLGLEQSMGISLITPLYALSALPVIAAGYYLLWKHAVGFFNHVAGVE